MNISVSFKNIIGCFWCVFPMISQAQVQPLSRQDSVILFSYEKKYESASTQNRYREAADNLNEIAFIYWNHNYYANAIEYYEKSLTFNERVGNENGVTMISNNLGMLYTDIKEFQKSLDYFNKTLAARRANQEPVGIISALINIAVVKNNLELFEESVGHLEEALALARELNDLEQMRSCYGMLAETYQKAGDSKKSLYYFDFYRSFHELTQKKKVENIQVDLEEERIKKQLLETEKIEINTKLQSKKEELNVLNQSLIDADSTLNLLNTELNAKTLQLQLIQKEKEILALKAEQEEEKLKEESQRRKNVTTVFSLSIIFLLIILLLILRNRKRIKAKNELLEERNQEISAINEELADSNRVKDTLFSVIAHDLKAPLGQLQQTFVLIEHNLFKEGEFEYFMQELHKNFKRSNLLLENLLQWAKSQIEGSSVSLQYFEINPVIEETKMVLEGLFSSKEITINFNFDYEGKIYADIDMVKLIVRNLLSNAIKFTPKLGVITIETVKEENFICIRVIDSGVGMSEEQMQQLFKKEVNTTTYGTEKEKGTGLGLKLTKNFIDLMNGTIEISSSIGKGSTFSVFLPIDKLN